MYWTREEIKKELLDNREQIEQSAYPEDLLDEYADGFIPVYNHEIIKDWIEMGSEYCDRWKEEGYDTQRNEGGIIQLMAVDLAFYYLEITREIWEEIQKESAENVSL